MDKNYFLEYYQLERENWWFKARSHIIRSQVEKLSDGKRNLQILNIGPATGATSEMLQEFGLVKSIEYDEDCFRFVKENLDIDIDHGSILDLPYQNETFDLVCAFDVIEHVEDDRRAMEEMTRVCKQNGNIMITVPAFMFLWSQHDVINHHYRRYTLLQLKNLLRKTEIVYLSYFNSLLFVPITFVRLIGRLIKFKRDGSGSDFGLVNSRPLNSFFHKLFKFENIWLRRGISIFFGISLIAVTRNK